MARSGRRSIPARSVTPTEKANPYPILSSNKTVTEETIEISYDFLSECTELFALWKS